MFLGKSDMNYILFYYCVLVNVKEQIDAQEENVSKGNRGGLSPLLLWEVAPRQWWWLAFGWYGCSIGW